MNEHDWEIVKVGFNQLAIASKDSITTVQQQLIDRTESWKGRVDAILADIDESQQTLVGIGEQMESIGDQVEDASAEFQEFEQEIRDQWDALFENMSNSVESRKERIEGFREFVVETLSTKWEELQDSAVELRDSILTTFQEHWSDGVEDLMNGTQSTLQAAITRKIVEFSRIGEMLKSGIEESMEEMQRFIAEELLEVVENEGQKTVDVALEKLTREIAESTVMSQMQFYITTLLTPYLSQLIAISTLAPAIRQALEIMRAGL